MNINFKSDAVLIVAVGQCDCRPTIEKDGSVGLTNFLVEPDNSFDAIEKWVGDDAAMLVRQEDGSFMSPDQMLGSQVPMVEVSVEARIPGLVMPVFSGMGKNRLMGVVGHMTWMRSRISIDPTWQHAGQDVIARLDELSNEWMTLSGRMSDYESVAMMLHGKVMIDLLSKVTEIRREAMARCKKVAEFYVMEPTLLHADANKLGAERGCVGFVEYGLVGFGKKET